MASSSPIAASAGSAHFLEVSWDAGDEEVLRALSAAGSKNGVLLLNDAPPSPIHAIKALFDTAYSKLDVMAQINQLYPSRLIFKDAAIVKRGTTTSNLTTANDDIVPLDRKVPFDICPRRLAALQSSPALVNELGQPFQDILGFFRGVEGAMLPRLMGLASTLLGEDVAAWHTQGNRNFRVIDYPPCAQGPHAQDADRCGEHRDFGSFTIIFQDELGGLEVQLEAEGGSAWVPVPAGRAVVLFGYCMAIRSNDRFKAALHRVRDAPAGPDGVMPRRSSAVLFVAPDMDLTLEPIIQEGEDQVYAGGMTVAELKARMARRWRKREGTDDGKDTLTHTHTLTLDRTCDVSSACASVEAPKQLQLATQDDVVDYYLRRPMMATTATQHAQEVMVA